MTGLPDLPPGWAWSTVAEVGEVQLGRQRAPKYHSGPNMRPYLRVANVFEDRIDTSDVMAMHFDPEEFERYRLLQGDILLNEGQSPELLGRPAMYRGTPVDVAFTNSLIRFRPYPGIEPEWALTVFRHYMWSGRFTRESRITTNIAHLSANRFKTVEFPVPPVEEQQRLVMVLEEHLSRVDGVVRALNAVQASLRAAHQRTLTAVVRGELGAAEGSDGSVTGPQLVEHRCRERGASPPVENGPWTLPSTWAWARIGDLFDVFVGATPSRANPDLWGGDVPWVSSGEVAFNRIAHTRETITSAAVGNPEKRLHPAGTVMLAMIGEGKTRGQAAILDVEAAHNQNCASIRVPGSGVLPEWVFWCLAERYDRTRRQGAGNNQPALNKARVQEIELPIPPADVQRHLVVRIERQAGTIASTSTAIDGLLTRCMALRRSLLQAAFTGRLGTHDPADEPADFLLKRLAEDRARSASTPHRRRARTAATAPAGAAAMPVEETG